MKIRKFIFGGAFFLATTALFSFKAESKFWKTGSNIDPISGTACERLGLIDDDCSFFNTGDRCTIWVSETYPAEPAFTDDLPPCTLPVYHLDF